MSEVATVLSLTDKALSIIGLVREGREKRDKKKQEALNSLYTALNETKLYNTERRNGKRKNLKRESAIARLWSHAAVAVAPFDARLADVCHKKRSYWSEVELWDDARINRNGIQLEKVLKKVRLLLLAK